MFPSISVFRLLALVSCGLFMCGATSDFSSSNGALFKKRYVIERGSKLYLCGTTNVNCFTCQCEDEFASRYVEVDPKGWQAFFKDATLDISVTELNCRNRRIESDLQKALKAEEYPQIKITLLETTQNPDCLDGKCKDWFDIYAKINLTITSVTKVQNIHARAKLLAPNRMELVGQQQIRMTDFGITPPEAMLGMIKVNENIDLHFDLIVSAE